MRVDLHAHSSASDGTESPGAVVEQAAAAGLDVVALTDHDTTAGWPEAVRAAERTGVALVRGVEISTRHRGRSVHLLGYLLDPTFPDLSAALASVIDARNRRVPAICARLYALGIDVSEEDVRRAAVRAAAAGRPHVADALVTAGVVRDRAEAFDRYLKPGRPAYVDREALPLTEAVPLVARAGGVSVLAHPWGRGGRSVLGAEDLAELRVLGLAGLEVDHEDHGPDARRDLRGLAEELDLVVTGSSDFHGAGKVGHDLGVNTTAPEQLEALLARAELAARASGRDAPTVVRP